MSGKRKAPLGVAAGLAGSAPQAGTDGGRPSVPGKRARFDASTSGEASDENYPPGGVEGDLDLDEQDRKRSQQGRRGRVVTDGYDSEDSEDDEDGDGMDGAGQGKGKVAGVDEDDDMFDIKDDAGGEGKEGTGGKESKKSAGKGKETRFLELGEIEGQEFGGGESDEEDRDKELELEDSGPDSDVDGEQTPPTSPGGTVQPRKTKRDKKGMGHKMDAFNMKAEMESGRFDEEGNYLANAKDPHAEHDGWLAGVYSRKGIRAAREAHEKREREERERLKARDSAVLPEADAKKRLVEILERGESVLEALQRLGAQAKKHKSAAEKSKKSYRAKRSPEKDKSKAASSSEMAVDEAAAPTGPPHPTIAALEELTTLSSTLMSHYGQINVYDETYESLLRAVRPAGVVTDDWDPATTRKSVSSREEPQAGPSNGEASNGLSAPPASPDPRRFQYKWAPAYLAATAAAAGRAPEPDTQIFGPFDADELRSWGASGYFGESGERILLRIEGGEGWQGWSDALGR